MFTISRIERFQQEIRKSKFIALATPINSEAEAKAFFASRSDLSANHNCWAWRVGQNYRFYDDGEPSGTAGKPILQAIDGQQLDNVAVLVTRWFGGILLGSGGLMRAYGGTAALCLRQAEKTELILTVDVRIGCDFSSHALLKARLEAVPNVQLLDEQFHGEGVDMRFSFPQADAENLQQLAIDLTSGKALISFEQDTAEPAGKDRQKHCK